MLSVKAILYQVSILSVCHGKSSAEICPYSDICHRRWQKLNLRMAKPKYVPPFHPNSHAPIASGQCSFLKKVPLLGIYLRLPSHFHTLTSIVN